MRQEILVGGVPRAQLSDLAVKGFELDAKFLRVFLATPVVLEAREPGELDQQRFVPSARMLLEPALAHPPDVAFFFCPVPRRMADQLGGGQYLGDNGVDLFAAFQQCSGDLHLCLVDRGVAGTLVAHRGESRLNVNWSGGAVPGIRSKRCAGAVAWLGAAHKQWTRARQPVLEFVELVPGGRPIFEDAYGGRPLALKIDGAGDAHEPADLGALRVAAKVISQPAQCRLDARDRLGRCRLGLVQQPIDMQSAAGFDHNRRRQKRLPDLLPYPFGRAVVILEIDVGVQADDPAYVLLAAPAGAIAKRADAEIKSYPRLIVALQEAFDTSSLARCQAVNRAVRPQRGEEDRALGRPLEQRCQRVECCVRVQHAPPSKAKGADIGSRRLGRSTGLESSSASPSLAFILRGSIVGEHGHFRRRLGGLRAALVEHRRSWHPVYSDEDGVVDRPTLAVGMLVRARADLHDRQVASCG